MGVLKTLNMKIDHSLTPLAAVQHRWAAATSGCCSVRMCANVCEAMTHFTLARLIMQRLFEALDKNILTLRRQQASTPHSRPIGIFAKALREENHPGKKCRKKYIWKACMDNSQTLEDKVQFYSTVAFRCC